MLLLLFVQVGACWNKLPPMHSYHSYAQCKKYVEKYFTEIRNGVISCYGHIPLVEIKVSLNRAFALLAGTLGSRPLIFAYFSSFLFPCSGPSVCR
jgi:hypothetical protein